METINKRQCREKLEVLSRKAVLCLSLFLCMSLVLPVVQAKENRMQTYLYLHEVDDELFPELERAPGVYSIEAALIKPGANPRIPILKESTVALMVSYTVLVLMKPPPKHDNTRQLERPAKIEKGAIYRAVFWVDPSPVLRDKTLLPGDILTLRYGKASASVVLPAR